MSRPARISLRPAGVLQYQRRSALQALETSIPRCGQNQHQRCVYPGRLKCSRRIGPTS
jgi:hypothetical protein